ncbi:MAG: phosphotransferase [Chloroflexi bacterium]|nr:phosphotransferase [Chloroflexota bacterium]
MNLRPLPETIADVTPEWLNSALSQTPALSPAPVREGGHIISLDYQPLEAMGKPVFRATADLETGDGRREPLDLLVKLHRQGATELAHIAHAGEAYFYSEVASRSGIPVPLTYISEYDDETGRLLIVQEFLTNGRIGAAETMLDANDQKRVLAALAKMHAHWWNSPELAQLLGIRTGKAAFQHGMELFESGAYDGKTFLSRFAVHVHPLVARYYATTTPWGPEIRDGFSNNTTHCHFDCSAKNIFIPDDQSQDPVLFDWGQVIRASVGIEIAQFLFSTTDPTAPSRFPGLVRYYHHQLLAGGVTGYTYDTLWNDFRSGCLVRLAAPIALAARGNPASDELP